MTRKQKTVLFLICAILFLLSSAFMVLYSQGFRVDIANGKITQTGAFYFKVLPKNAQVFLDDKFKRKTDFFFSASLLEGLLPQKYNVKIKKEGYFTWEKNLEVKNNEVTEAKNIILIKEHLDFSSLLSGAKQLFFPTNESKIIFLEEQPSSWELKLYDLNTNIKSHLIKATDIGKKDVKFTNLTILSGNRLLLETTLKNEKKYFLINAGENPAALIALDFLGKNPERIELLPGDQQKLLFLNKGNINEGDLTKKTIGEIFKGPVGAFTVSDNQVYILTKDGHLYKTSTNFSEPKKLNELPFAMDDKQEYAIYVIMDRILIKSGGDLYLFNKDNQKPDKLIDKNAQLVPSPDLEKIAYSSEFEIWILFLKDQSNQPLRKAEEKVFLTRFSEKISNIFWLSSNYLIFNVDGKIKVAEIDDRDRINIVDIANSDNQNMYFSQFDKKLYTLKEENLLASEPLW
ncbi:MAG: hypothetical protein US98_C0011G0003 [Parcubacteria group bacterium GW2011_GWC1_38_6]|nr:MAG: hypothetical protein US98_C0011G0003 [Parcubacteria group bacterium GW2011_GWC1_38_6]